jgi:hypothetical protein
MLDPDSEAGLDAEGELGKANNELSTSSRDVDPLRSDVFAADL